MILCSSTGKLCLQLRPGAVAAIHAEIQQKHPVETGGVLLGYYDSRYHVATVVVATTPPTDSQHGRTHFVRGMHGLSEILIDARKQTPPIFYLGEWHTHPGASPTASSIDVRQMAMFARQHTFGSRSPLLLIVGGSPPDQLQWRATLHRRWKWPVSLESL
ncbi:Mov34/MPN/PAD-1 family protein [Hymenobacter sp. NST-14]|uniref:Mov34/MPN/PAD-1 family protein n=1 Tax=Hymenobacter piscis TaxID=2839984 RepID=UPI001C02C35E|nr:Mov34/MPN/PAD-1 family protein [Hymenobacter piscis]